MAHIILRKVISTATAPFIFVCALAFALLALAQIILVAGFIWLNAGQGGRDLLNAYLADSLAESGYTLALARITYDPLRGFALRDIQISDQDGILAEADRIILSPGLMALPAGILNLSIDGGAITIYRWPASTEEKTEDQDFILPGMPAGYIGRVVLRQMTIERLTLPDKDGQISLSPALSADLTLGERPVLRASLRPQIAAYKNIPQNLLPKQLTLQAYWDAATQDFFVEQFDISAPSATLHASGQGGTRMAPLDYKIEIGASNLKGVTENHLRALTAEARIKGTTAHPILDLTGNLDSDVMDRPVIIEARYADNDLEVKALSAYAGEDFAIQSRMSLKDNILDITALSADMAGFSLSGVLRLALDHQTAQGDIKISATSLADLAGIIGMEGLDGSVNATLSLRDDVAGAQEASLNLDAPLLRHEDISLSRLNLRATWPDVKKRLVPQNATVTAASVAQGTTAHMNDLRLALQPAPDADTDIEFDLRGHTLYGALSLAARIGGTDIETLRIAAIVLTLDTPGGTLRGRGRANAEDIDIHLDGKGLALASMLPDGGGDALSSWTGDIKAALTGTAAAPQWQSTVRLDDGRDVNIALQTIYQEQTIRTDVKGSGQGITTLSGYISLPLNLRLQPFAFDFSEATPVSGEMNMAANIASLPLLGLPPLIQVAGALTANITIDGTIATPRIDGRAALRDAAFNDRELGIVLEDINAEATFTREELHLSTLSATDGVGGTLRGDGRLSWAGARDAAIDLRATRFHLPRGELADGYVDAVLSLRGNGDGMVLSGAVDIEEINITIPERFSQNIPSLNIIADPTAQVENHPGENIRLDLTINAPGRVFVRGWGLDAEFAGNVAINGTAREPLFDGSFSTRRGRYDEFGKTFALNRAVLRFQGAVPPSPYLDIEAATPAGDVEAKVLLSGPVTAPAIRFAAVPALPEDEVLSRILFGRSTARISPFQAVQLTQTLRRFSGQGGGGFDAISTIRNITGLDNITVDTDESGDTQIGVGKYLNDKMYLQFERGAGESGSAATLQIEVTPSINVQTEIGQDARSGGGVFWRRDY